MSESETKKVCKYGGKCYRKNPEHLKEFHQKEEDKNSESPKPKRTKLDSKTGSQKPISHYFKANGTKQDSKSDFQKYKKMINERFLVEMPPDFYAIWSLAQKLNPNDPRDAFSPISVRLVGPFDLMADISRFESLSEEDALTHWRFPLDLPEFQTVFYSQEKNFHVGYWRDIPSELPSAVFSLPNDVKNWPKYSLMGDNLVAALYFLASKNDKIQKELQVLAEKDKFHLDLKSTPKLKERKKNIVAPTLHGAGIWVKVHDGWGYRDLGMENAALKKIVTTIATTDDRDLRNAKINNLQETVTYIQFANDEADYGMGLEFGHDMFVSGYQEMHEFVGQTLPMAYQLLNRSEFIKILTVHIKNRNQNVEKWREI